MLTQLAWGVTWTALCNIHILLAEINCVRLDSESRHPVSFFFFSLSPGSSYHSKNTLCRISNHKELSVERVWPWAVGRHCLLIPSRFKSISHGGQASGHVWPSIAWATDRHNVYILSKHVGNMCSNILRACTSSGQTGRMSTSCRKIL